jgi:Ca-activated chloride channel family protein
MLEFAHPWLFLCLPLPLLAYWILPVYKESKDSIQVPFFQRLVNLTGQTPGKGSVVLPRELLQRVLLVVSWLLIVIAMARPEWLGDPIVREKSARDLMIAVDLSGSMEVADFRTADGENISRLNAVKSVLQEFVDQRQHDRLGLIVFGDAAYLQAPFTEDHSAWMTLLNETEIGMAGQSTVFGDAIGLAIKLFENTDTDNRVLIVLTDGNDTGSKVPPVDAAKVAAQYDITIYTIAVGDPATTGEEALDLDVLQRIAELTGGGYYQALDRKQLEQAYRAINDLEPELFESLSHRPRTSLHHYPLAATVSIYLLIFSALTGAALWRRLRKHHA